MLQPRFPSVTLLLGLVLPLGLVSAQGSATATGSVNTAGSTTLATSTITSAPSSTSASSSSSRKPQTFTVEVGPGDFIYKPDRLDNVLVNDTVLFQFYPPDHSVARAEYGNPCVPYEYTGKDKVGFFSGVKYVDTAQNLAEWSLLINDTEPIFFYCTAPGSCIDHQMVGAINPNSTQTLAYQKTQAKQAKFMVVPGDPLPAEGSASLSAPAGAATSTPPPSSSNQSHGVHLSGGAIAGIVVGAVAFLIICAALFFFVGRTKSLKEVLKRNDATIANKTTPNTPGTEFGGPHGPQSPGFSPFSPTQNHAEYGNVPPYGQHQVSDPNPGWATPTQHPGHMSQNYQPQMSEHKPANVAMYHPAEMASPPAHQQTFTHELEAPLKGPR